MSVSHTALLSLFASGKDYTNVHLRKDKARAYAQDENWIYFRLLSVMDSDPSVQS